MQEHELIEIEGLMGRLRKMLDFGPVYVDNATIVDEHGKILGVVRWREGQGNGSYDFEPHIEQPPMAEYLH